MSLIQRIKAVLGLTEAPQVEDDVPVAVTVEHDPTPNEEDTAGVSEDDPTPDDKEAAAESDDDAGPEHDGPVTEISGIGPSYSEQLASIEITTVAELAGADASNIAAETDLSETRVAGWIEAANDLASGN